MMAAPRIDDAGIGQGSSEGEGAASGTVSCSSLDGATKGLNERQGNGNRDHAAAWDGVRVLEGGAHAGGGSQSLGIVNDMVASYGPLFFF